MGGALSSVTEMVLPLAEKAISLVADPIAAALPGTGDLFKSVSQSLLGEHPPSNKEEHKDAQEVRHLVDEEIPKAKGVRRQEAMARVLELLMDELER